MKLAEFKKVKDMTYLEYCDYLQEKYGIGLADYMTRSFNKNRKVSRTAEGLFAHHKMEDRMIMLSTKEYAELCPFEWQQKENIVYCDFLEHLLLHILICKYPSKKKVKMADVGIGGVVNFIVPELNDVYSGWITAQGWRRTCHERIIDDIDVYFHEIAMFLDIVKNRKDFDVRLLFTSANSRFGAWDPKNNMNIYKEIYIISKIVNKG